MLGNYLDPTQSDAELQKQLEQWQQEQLRAKLEGQDIGGPATNMTQGLTMLGAGLARGITGWKQQGQLADQQALTAKLLGGMGDSSPMPFPRFSPKEFPMLSGQPMASGGELPSALQSVPAGVTGVNNSVASTISGEAGPTLADKIAVANVIRNRASTWGQSPEGVVSAPGQFEAYRIHKKPDADSMKVAAMLAGGTLPTVLPKDTLYFKGDVGQNSPTVAAGLRVSPGGNYYSNRNNAPSGDYAARFRASIDPSSYGVPSGQVAGGNAVPSVLPKPIAAPIPEAPPLEGRSVGMAAPPISAAVPPPQPAPDISSTPMGPPVGLTPPPVGGGPGAAAAGAPPMAAAPTNPPPAPQPAAIPPVAVQSGRVMAPATGGTAYDPRTGRFLAPGEQIPGYAPAPMSSTGGHGGLDGLLASLFGGGAQAAPAAPAGPALARGLSGGAPQIAQQGAPTGPPQGSPAIGPSGQAGPTGPQFPAGQPVPSAQTNQIAAQLEQQYNSLNQQAQAARRQAKVLGIYNHPGAAQMSHQADQLQSQAEKIREKALDMAIAEQNLQPLREKFPDGSIHQINPKTGADMGVFAPAAPKEPKAPEHFRPGEMVQDPTAPGGFRQVGEVPEKTTADKIVKSHDAMGNEVQGTVKDNVFTPLQMGGAPAAGGAPSAPVAASSGGAGPAEEGMEAAPMQGAIPGTIQPASPALSKDEEARLQALPGVTEGYKNRLRSILVGDQTPPTKSGTARGDALMSNLQAVRKDFSAAQAQSQVGVRKDFASGPQGKLIVSANSILDHATEWDTANKAAGTGAFLGAEKRLYNSPIGNLTPTGAITNANALGEASNILSTEATKFLTGAAQGGGEKERERQAARIGDMSLPPESRRKAVDYIIKDSLQRLMETQAKWKSSFQGQDVGDFPILSDNAIANAKKMGFGDWFDKDNNLVGEGKGVKAEAPAPEARYQGGNLLGALASNPFVSHNPDTYAAQHPYLAPSLAAGLLGGAGLASGARAAAPVIGAGARAVRGYAPDAVSAGAKGLAEALGKSVGKTVGVGSSAEGKLIRLFIGDKLYESMFGK